MISILSSYLIRRDFGDYRLSHFLYVHLWLQVLDLISISAESYTREQMLGMVSMCNFLDPVYIRVNFVVATIV